MDFSEIPYESTEGHPWTEKSVLLSVTAAKYGLASAPKLSYVELGEEGGRTLVFVHGLGSYLKFWRYQLDEFAEDGYRVLAVDLLGFGRSDKPAGFSYSMEAQAEALAEWLDALGVDKPVLVGHSMGGQTILSHAIQHPDRVGALVLTSPAGFERFSSREKVWFKSVFSTTFVKSASESAIWTNVAWSNFYDFRPELHWLIEERVRVAGSPAFDAYAYANVRSVQGLADNDFVRTNLARVKAPTLIVYGDKDRLIPNAYLHGGHTRDVMAYGHAHIHGSRLVELPDCGHSVQLDCPEAYNRGVRSFLEGLATSPTE